MFDEYFFCTPHIYLSRYGSPPTGVYISWYFLLGCSNSSNERPLVLMYGWLLSRSRHIYKYADFYLGNNFDVLHVKIHPFDLLQPKRSFKVRKIVHWHIRLDVWSTAMSVVWSVVYCHINWPISWLVDWSAVYWHIHNQLLIAVSQGSLTDILIYRTNYRTTN